MMRKLLFFLPAVLLSVLLSGQTPDLHLPRFLTAEEKLLSVRPAPGALAGNPGNNNPPSVPVRAMAEWEELQALLISWRGQTGHLAILAEIVRAAREECRVIIACNNANTVASAQNYLQNKGVDLSSNVDFLTAPTNSIWIRDYGPNPVYANDVDTLFMVDWIYNRPRPDDDTLSRSVAQFLGIPLYNTLTAPNDLVHTGGNFMSDGMGTAFSSTLVLDENGPDNLYGQSNHSEAEVDALIQAFMGIDRYPKMEKLPYDGIHHIDMHMKLLDEETLLVGQYPPGVADGPQIEANIQYVLSNFTSAFGTPYKVVRVPMPPDAGDDYPNAGGDYRTYANAVFVNKTVLVPFYEEAYDTTARRIWEEALPGYNIVGIDCNSIIPSLGAIHCITKEVGVADPLRIVHQPLADVNDNNVPGYPVQATIQHRSGIASARVFYATSPDGPWLEANLASFTGNEFAGMIPQQPAGTTVYYYIQASATSGKTQVRPLPAPAGWWKFTVQDAVSGVNDLPETRLNAIYPNPAAAITCLPVWSSRSTAASLCMFNALGQRVETVFDGQLPAGLSNHFIDAAAYVPGAYTVVLRHGTRTSVQKLLVR
jgi:agmatine deiminase